MVEIELELTYLAKEIPKDLKRFQSKLTEFAHQREALHKSLLE